MYWPSLDRIGQTRDVQIYVPCLSNSTQQDLARWYHEGLKYLLKKSCPIGMALFEQYETFIKSAVRKQREF